MNRRESFGPSPRPASARTVYLLILLPIVLLVVIGGGIYYSLTREPETVTRFKEGFRFPESMPDWLGRAGGYYANAGRVQTGERLPYVTFNWQVCADTVNPKTRLSLSIALEHQEMDLEGQSRTAVEVDGVQGWLSRLDILDFVLPNRDDLSYKDYMALRMEWDYDRHIYSQLIRARREFLSDPLAGPAIALQWNREGFHYLLFAEDREPLNAEVLMRIANSMAPSPYPEYGDITPGRSASRGSHFGVRCPAV